jgi:hypothetical protein
MDRQQAIQQDRRQAAQPRSATTPSAVAGGATQQRLQQLESQRRLSGNERRELRQLQRDERQNALKLQGSEQKSTATGNPQRLQQLEGKRDLTRTERRELQQLRRDERQNVQQNLTADQPKSAATDNQQRIQELQSKGRLTASERRELQQLRRDERQDAQRNLTPDQLKATSASNQQRIQELQSKARLTPSERRELQQLRSDERQNAQQNLTPDQLKAASAKNQQRIEALQSKGRLTPAEQRELRQLQRDERQNARLQQQQQQQQQRQQQQAAQDAAAQSRRAQRRQQVSAQQVAQGRFAASNLSAHYQGRRAAKRLARLAALTAWQLGVLAPYVPWRGPVYWPYAYADVFYYTFWPDAYDPYYWAYAYDDFFDGVFFPDGAPYVEYAAEGPYEGYGSYGRTTTGYAPRSGTYDRGRAGPPARPAPGRVNQATRDFCADQASGVTAWPIGKIADAVQPTSEQKGLLDNLRKASQEAAAQFRDACPESVPMTPPGRLQAMTQRLQATSDAVGIVKPAMEAFYNSLSDEQKARFNEIGPQLAKSQPGSQQRPQRAAEPNEQTARADCSSEKAGISNIAVDRIEELVQPTQAQEPSLDRLDDAMQKAVDVLRDACPNTVAMTPVGRLEAMKQRLDAMIQAANTVRPALEDFYAALTDEQKAKFNRLGRQAAQSGG